MSRLPRCGGVVLGLGLAALAGCQGEKPMVMGTSRGELHVSVDGDARPPGLEFTYDVGSVAVGQRKELVVRGTNVGLDPLRVLGVSLGSGGNGSWYVRDAAATLQPLEATTVRVTFSPVATGEQTTTLTFAHDADAQLPVVRLGGTGS